MSLPVVIAIIVVADALLLSGLAWVMSQARKLDSHAPAQPGSLKLVETLYAYSTDESEQERRAA
jgi:hypothetical protein